MADNKNNSGDSHAWRFFRYGGFDQVAIETGDDLRHLAELDPKLWTALSCPSTSSSALALGPSNSPRSSTPGRWRSSMTIVTARSACRRSLLQSTGPAGC